MLSFFINKFIQISNWSPILHASSDSQFGSIVEGRPDRFSLLGLSLGKRKLYIISFKNDHASYKFNLIFNLKFDSLCKISSESEVNDKVNSYKEELSTKSDDSIRNEIDFLKYKISLNKSRTVSGYNKTNIYTAIILVYTGFIAFMLEKVIDFSTNNPIYNYLTYVVVILAIYYLFNCVLFIKSALSIKGYTRSAFRDIRKDSGIKNIASAYYTDWYSTYNESQVTTSVVANIEKYFTRSFLMSIFLWIILLAVTHFSLPNKEVAHTNDEYLIYDELGDFQELEFVKFITDLNEGSESIYIISNIENINSSILGRFIRSTLSNSERVIEIRFKNNVVSTNSVIIKRKD